MRHLANASGLHSPNILTNWDFRNPINQYDQTEYSGSNQYTIDRWWIMSGTTVTLHDGYIEARTSNHLDRFVQNYDEEEFVKTLYSQTITFSILTKDVKNAAMFFRYGDSSHTYLGEVSPGLQSNTLNTVTFKFDKLNAKTLSIGVIFTASDDDAFAQLVAAKVEIGDHQTLAHEEDGVWMIDDPTPDPELELMKCQRHLRVINGNTWQIGYAGCGVDTAGTYLTTAMPFPMRKAPTVKITGDSKINLKSESASLTVKSISAIKQSGLTILQIFPNETISTKGIYRIVPLTGTKIILDAN